MNEIESIIVNSIIESAKSKFDIISFEKIFIDIDDDISDAIIAEIIMGFALKESKELISAKLLNEILLFGFIWKKEDIDEFLIDKEILFKQEIFATQLSGTLLHDGNDPLDVLETINQLLE